MFWYQYIDENGDFQVSDPENTSGLYFPIANEVGVKSAVSPLFGGDCKFNQNQFITLPVSVEDLHNSKSTRNFWCQIEGKGIWSATGMSMEQLSKQCTQQKEKTILNAGFMNHTMYRVSQEFGIASRVTLFAPLEDKVEIMRVDLRNISKAPLTLTATAAVPIYGRSADDLRDHRHVTSLLHRIETKEDGVYVTPTLTFDERGHQKNSMVYYVAGYTQSGEKPRGFFPRIDQFIGEGGDFLRPQAIYKGATCITSEVKLSGYEAMGGIQFETITLESEEEQSYLIYIGGDQGIEPISDTLSKYNTVEKVEDAYRKAKTYWKNSVNVKYQTADKDFDNFMRWVNFQPMLRRIYGCSFLPHHDYGKGGRGWRDLWQDCLALLIMNPDGVRDMILNNYAGVRIDGSNATIIGENLGEFKADRNNITRVWMDHGFWPLLTTDFYIQQTGDINILLEETTYFKDQQLARGLIIDLEQSDTGKLLTLDNKIYQGSILEHILIENLTAFYDVGEHNHIRLRGADWNDALDMASTRGESVAFTAAYAGNLSMIARLLRRLKEVGVTTIQISKEVQLLLQTGTILYENISFKLRLLNEYYESCGKCISGDHVDIICDGLIANLEEKAEWLKEHIRRTEWIELQQDAWFNGYYDNDGIRVEGEFDSGIRMMLTSQVFAIMSDTATSEQVSKIVKAADHYLYEEKMGGYRLNTDFKEVKLNLGRMFGFAYGHKENGAVFSHMTIMYGNALYQRGFAKEGYKVISALFKQANNADVSKIYPGIPEYFNEEGRGMYHYLTGAASWLMLTVMTQMFGVRGRFGDLLIEPKLMKEQFDESNKARIQYVFRGKEIEVVFHNKERLEYGKYSVAQVKIDGKLMSGVKEISIENGQCVISKECIDRLEKNRNHDIRIELN